MILLRKEAVILSSFLKFFILSLEERKAKTENALAEIESDNVTEEDSNRYLRKYLEHEFKFFTNNYLQIFLTAQLGKAVVVKGQGPKLYTCDCCEYKTLSKKGEYFICKVCYWEDDWNIDLNNWSSVNNMTLHEAKENFKKLGFISKKFSNYIDDDRMIMYEQ